MEQLYRIIGDGFSIAALAIIFAVSLNAWKRVPAEVKVPMQFDRKGEPTRRMDRRLALWFTPVLALVLMFLPTLTGVTHNSFGQDAMLLMVMRILLAGALSASHTLHMVRAMKVLQDEGSLRS